MEKATVKYLFKNNRYRVIHTKSNYYLIDADHSILGYLFFIFNWMIPQKAYKITERDAEDLIVHRHNMKKQNNLNLLGMGLLMIIFSVITPKAFDYFIESTVTFGDLRRFGDMYFLMPPAEYVIFLLGLVVAPAVLFRVYLSIRAKNRLMKTVNIEKKSIIYIKLHPSSVLTNLKTIAVYVFFGFLLIATACMLIILSGYWIISLSLAVNFLLFSFTNLLSFNPGDYKIRSIKEK